MFLGRPVPYLQSVECTYEKQEEWRLEANASIPPPVSVGGRNAAFDIASLASYGVIPLNGEPVDFAENVTTTGLRLYELPIGTRLQLGNTVRLEVTQIGKTCHNRCQIFHQVGDCVMPREGIFARVLQGGEVNVGDGIRILSISPDGKTP